MAPIGAAVSPFFCLSLFLDKLSRSPVTLREGCAATAASLLNFDRKGAQNNEHGQQHCSHHR